MQKRITKLTFPKIPTAKKRVEEQSIHTISADGKLMLKLDGLSPVDYRYKVA